MRASLPMQMPRQLRQRVIGGDLALAGPSPLPGLYGLLKPFSQSSESGNREGRASVSAIAFGIGLALAAIAGVFAPFMLGSMTPAMGVDVTVTSFTVIVIGSLGNPLGTVLGGLIYGVSYMFMQSYFSSWANLLPYLLLIAILLVRPSGLLGRQVRRA
jgi:hypothetical protein